MSFIMGDVWIQYKQWKYELPTFSTLLSSIHHKPNQFMTITFSNIGFNNIIIYNHNHLQSLRKIMVIDFLVAKGNILSNALIPSGFKL
jgi:hypothetical protein